MRESAAEHEGSVVSKAGQVRRILFDCGLAAVTLSIGLVLGSFIRPVHSQDYLEQAREGIPWVRWGLCSALIGFALCFFGNRGWRIIGVLMAFLLFVWWFLIGMSLF
jgi:hypothetical protein